MKLIPLLSAYSQPDWLIGQIYTSFCNLRGRSTGNCGKIWRVSLGYLRLNAWKKTTATGPPDVGTTLLYFSCLLLGHGRIATGESTDPAMRLSDTAAATNALIVDINIWVHCLLH